MSSPPEPRHDPDQGMIIGIGRVDILNRVGKLLRCDWSMRRFDGRDCNSWIHTAIYGSAEDMREVDKDLAELETE